MDSSAAVEAPTANELRNRQQIPDRFKWDLTHIFSDWTSWQAAYDELDAKIGQFARLQGTLVGGPDHLLAALRLRDDIGQLEYKVWYFAALWYDQDQRDNQINGKRQQVQILFAKAAQAAAWFDPELLAIGLDRVRQWMAEVPELAMVASNQRSRSTPLRTMTSARAKASRSAGEGS
jgi:oligoendopeptidase F